MKWIILLTLALLSTACVYSSDELVQYRQVTVTPVVEPAVVDTEYPGPLDVSGTTVSFY